MIYTCLLPVLLLSLSKTANSQTINPCPDKFTFNPERNQPGRWFGTVRLVYETELSGVWLRLKFDRPVIQLGNWFGQIKTDDNIEFRLSDRTFQLKPNVPKDVLFFVNYNQRDPPPELVRIILNGRVFCPMGQETTTSTLVPGLGEPITSRPLTSFAPNPAITTTTYRPFGGQQNVNTGSFRPTARPSRRPTTAEYENESDDEFFQGDLSGARPNIMTPSREDLNDICGTVIARPKPLITHGEVTHEGEFPWHAAIYHSKGVNLVYICGASLINKEYLLTAAHCVTKPRTETPSKIGSMVIYLGKHYLKEWSTKGIQDRRVSKLIVHPEFESETFKNDIAIIKLSEPITVTNYVRPVCLWEDAVELHHVVNQPGTIIGWGYDEDGVITDELHKASMPIVSTETCIYSYPDFFARFTSNTTFCAGYRNGETIKCCPSYIHLCEKLQNDFNVDAEEVIKCMRVYENFLSIDEEADLLQEIEPYMKKLRYEYDHWDNAIHGYRETERLAWNHKNTKILGRVRRLAFPPETAPLKYVHILDLAENGYIKPHIDAVRFCGNTIAGLSLLTDSVMRLVNDKNKELYVDILLKRRSLYVMTDGARYKYTHEILDNKASFFKNKEVHKTRRISVICRNEPTKEK